jgi:hypothetical protein
MKSFFARLFNLFTIIASISFFVGIANIDKSGDQGLFLIFMAIWFGVIAGLNYLVLGKPTLWNGKQD